VIKFIIFYGDGSTFEGGQPEDAPVENVQAIAVEHEIRAPNPYTMGRFVLDSWDYYIYSDGAKGWHGTNRTSDLIDHLKQGLGPGGVRAVLTGRWIADRDYRALIERAKTEGDFHDKSSEPKYPGSGVETD